MFIKELGLYVSYLSNQINESFEITSQQIKKWETFKANLLDGIEYYKSIFQEKNSKIQNDILQLELQLKKIEFNTIPV